MDWVDIRNKKMVYLNHCLLNVNARGPGYAFRTGASKELIEILLKNDVNIEQLPCMECKCWGGVSRKSFDKNLPLLRIVLKYGWYPILKPYAIIELFTFNRQCKRSASMVADGMEDFIREGYKIIGVIGMNDSPTCGVTKTLDFDKMIQLSAKYSEEENPRGKIIEGSIIDGSGFFIGNLIEEIRRRQLKIKVIGYEPWAESQADESKRVAKLLDLQI